MNVTRRTFLGTTAAAVTASGASAMPTRVLGRTGAKVSVLVFGCGSRFLQYENPDKAAEAIHRALDSGITYFDTAASYGDGKSEQWLSRALEGRRKGIWVTTKITERDGDGAVRRLEQSIKTLGHVDMVHIHSLSTADDLARIEAKGAVLERFLKLRDQKVVRAVGITSHTDPAVLKTALERNDFDCTQMALNAARQGFAKPERDPGGSFESLALPVANRKNLGVIAMKIFAQEHLSGKAPADKLITYSLSLPVTAVVVGMPKLEFLDANVQTAKSFRPMPADEMKHMSRELSGAYKVGIDRDFLNHVDA